MKEWHMNPFTIEGGRIHRAARKAELKEQLAALDLADERFEENEVRWRNESAPESYFRVRAYRIGQALRDVRSVLSSRYDRRERKWKRGPRGKQPTERRNSAVRVFDAIYREWQPVYAAALRDERLIHQTYDEIEMPVVVLSLAVLAARAKVTSRSVSDLLTKIEQRGYIKRHERSGKTTAYEVVLPDTPMYINRQRYTVAMRSEQIRGFRYWLSLQYPKSAQDLGLLEEAEAAA